MADRDASPLNGLLPASPDPDTIYGVWGPDGSDVVEAFKQAHPDWIAVPAEFTRPRRPTIPRMARLRPRGAANAPSLAPPAGTTPPAMARMPDFTAFDMDGLAAASSILGLMREARRPMTDEGMPEVIPVQGRRRGGPGPQPLRIPGGGFADLTAEQEFLLYNYIGTSGRLRQLEPDNPLLTVMRAPNTPPSRQEVDDLNDELVAARLRARRGEPPRTLYQLRPPGTPGEPPQAEPPPSGTPDLFDPIEPLPDQETLAAIKAGRTPEEYADLARDPAKSGGIDSKSRLEREIGIELEQRGDLRGPIRRDPRQKGGEFIDAAGQAWDIKGFTSHRPVSQGGFTLESSMTAIREEIADGENIILDTSNLTPEHIAQLRTAVENEGLSTHIRWWP